MTVENKGRPEVLPEVDSPPSSGRYVDHDAVPLSDNEAAEGNTQGENIDTDDDNDNGLDDT